MKKILRKHWKRLKIHKPDTHKGCPLKSNEKKEKNGAGEGSRTLGIQLGRLMLYQLSYSRTKERR